MFGGIYVWLMVSQRGRLEAGRVRSDPTCLGLYDTEPNHHYTVGCALSNSRSGPVNFDITTQGCVSLWTATDETHSDVAGSRGKR